MFECSIGRDILAIKISNIDELISQYKMPYWDPQYSLNISFCQNTDISRKRSIFPTSSQLTSFERCKTMNDKILPPTDILTWHWSPSIVFLPSVIPVLSSVVQLCAVLSSFVQFVQFCAALLSVFQWCPPSWLQVSLSSSLRIRQPGFTLIWQRSLVQICIC